MVVGDSKGCRIGAACGALSGQEGGPIVVNIVVIQVGPGNDVVRIAGLGNDERAQLRSDEAS